MSYFCRGCGQVNNLNDGPNQHCEECIKKMSPYKRDTNELIKELKEKVSTMYERRKQD